MAQPSTGRYGKLKSAINDGVAFTNQALTPVASKVIGGKTYTNRFVTLPGQTHWNKNPEKKATFCIQGIIGETTVTPGAANDKISVGALSYYKDNTRTNGVLTVSTAAANTAVAVTRPSAGTAIWVAILLDIAAGTFSALSGKEVTGTRTALVSEFGDPSSGTAGAMPLVGVDKLIVCMVKVDSNSAALFSASDITYVDDNGRLIQERSDIPNAQEILLEGGVLLGEALLPCHTGAIGRVVYASGYSQVTSLSDVADLINWKISVSRGVTSMPGKGDAPPGKEIGSGEDVSGSASFYQTGRSRFDLFRKSGGYVILYPDSRDTTQYFEGAAIFSSFDENNDDGAMVNNINFGIDGFLERRGA